MSDPDLFGERPVAAPFAGAALYIGREPAIANAFNPDAAAVLTGAALRDTIAERLAQIDRRGFSLEVDAGRGAAHLAALSRQYLQIAIDRLSAAGALRQPEAARKRLVAAAALALASIDAIDAATIPDARVADSPVRSEDLIFDDDRPKEEI